MPTKKEFLDKLITPLFAFLCAIFVIIPLAIITIIISIWWIWTSVSTVGNWLGSSDDKPPTEQEIQYEKEKECERKAKNAVEIFTNGDTWGSRDQTDVTPLVDYHREIYNNCINYAN